MLISAAKADAGIIDKDGKKITAKENLTSLARPSFFVMSIAIELRLNLHYQQEFGSAKHN